VRLSRTREDSKLFYQGEIKNISDDLPANHQKCLIKDLKNLKGLSIVSNSELIAGDQFTIAFLLRACKLPMAVTIVPRKYDNLQSKCLI
jgi:hypothetical protein